VCRVILLEVEQAACKKSRLSWAVCMQKDRFQPISYKIIAAGPPAALYHRWSSSWRVKQRKKGWICPILKYQMQNHDIRYDVMDFYDIMIAQERLTLSYHV
jgi:hypothetical protein